MAGFVTRPYHPSLNPCVHFLVRGLWLFRELHPESFIVKPEDFLMQFGVSGSD
jgi:hypothetical protein